MKILKTESIKDTVTNWAKITYPDCEVEANYHYVSVRKKDIGSVDFSILKRRNIRIRGAINTFQVGGGIMIDGRRDNSIIIHGGAKSDFGIFDEVELKRRIDARFAKKIADREASQKAEQVFKDRLAVISPILVSNGFIFDNSYSWRKTWNYQNKLRVTLSNGGSLQLDFLNTCDMPEDEVLKLAKGVKELIDA